MSYYSVIYYTPSKPTEERVNFGVVVWDNKDDKMLYKFVDNWDHVLHFCEGGNVGFLEEYAESFGTRFRSAADMEKEMENETRITLSRIRSSKSGD